ncbi:MAG: cytochrome C oxidase subunit IV family protein [Chlamydiae bacterium]|nr:cytochrome C oxidase subunit IV family protein [Chlamydiota bacterium]MBI3277250.1 cytochrome C oxidase subunit IV family protein [Chlamydiota bacterium]
MNQENEEASKSFSHPNYMGVWGWLLGLTALEVAALYLPILQGTKIIILVTLAITKALLVAMYFMHLKFERVILIAIILYPIILSITLTLLTGLSLYRF